VANRLLKRVRDFAQVDGQKTITAEVADKALDMLEVDRHGLDEMDRRILLTIIDKFQGGPLGVDTLSTAVCEEKNTLEDVYEPFLIQSGFLIRTPRGRMATQAAYEHFKRPYLRKEDQPGLF
jgi:Holliday junction DNA helicase RuvB